MKSRLPRLRGGSTQLQPSILGAAHTAAGASKEIFPPCSAEATGQIFQPDYVTVFLVSKDKGRLVDWSSAVNPNVSQTLKIFSRRVNPQRCTMNEKANSN